MCGCAVCVLCNQTLHPGLEGWVVTILLPLTAVIREGSNRNSSGLYWVKLRAALAIADHSPPLETWSSLHWLASLQRFLNEFNTAFTGFHPLSMLLVQSFLFQEMAVLSFQFLRPQHLESPLIPFFLSISFLLLKQIFWALSSKHMQNLTIFHSLYQIFILGVRVPN